MSEAQANNLPFGQALRQRREAAGLTLAQLAARAQVTERQLGNLERGESWPRRTTWQKLAQVFPDLPTTME